MKKFGIRMNHNGNICLIHTREDITQIMKFCNLLADKVDELCEENNRLREKIEEMGGVGNER